MATSGELDRILFAKRQSEKIVLLTNALEEIIVNADGVFKCNFCGTTNSRHHPKCPVTTIAKTTKAILALGD